jgi:twitching motility protein PilJ
VLGSKVVRPVQEITEFSEKIAGGDNNARLEISAQNDFAVVAENWNRLAEKLSRTGRDQQAQDTLQKSVTEFLTIVSQIARGDLTLRGKVTNDALGNVVDSVNYMLDNFGRVIERVRNAAVDVSSSANEILISSEEMAGGASQQDQEITNTSSAVEELTGSTPLNRATARCAIRSTACSASVRRCKQRQRRSSRWAIVRWKFLKSST